MAQMYRIIPVTFEEGRLTIAMCDPQNLSVQDELRSFLGFEIRVLVATEPELRQALAKYYEIGRAQSELQSLAYLVCRLLLEKKKTIAPARLLLFASIHAIRPERSPQTPSPIAKHPP